MISTVLDGWCDEIILDQQKLRQAERKGGDFKHTVAILDKELKMIEKSAQYSKKKGKAIYMLQEVRLIFF